MIDLLRRELLDDQLPAALCTSKMRTEVDTAARELGVSDAAIIRAAVEIFLSEHLNQIKKQLEEERKNRPAKRRRNKKSKSEGKTS